MTVEIGIQIDAKITIVTDDDAGNTLAETVLANQDDIKVYDETTIPPGDVIDLTEQKYSILTEDEFATKQFMNDYAR